MPPQGQEIQALHAWLGRLGKDQRWAVVIMADPDAIGSAYALRRIMASRTRVDIFRINEITRPDNQAMMRYLHMEIGLWHDEYRERYTHFAIVDGQPHHHVIFSALPFSVVIDHHPLPRTDPQPGPEPCLRDVRPGTGACCTLFAQYLRALSLRPSPSLATAMVLGIRTDTALFERSGGREDFEAYQWLSGKADDQLLRRIVRSEYLLSWLPLFSRAFKSLRRVRRTGSHVWLGEVESADLLVAIADFFTRVHGLRWTAVSGIVQKETVVVIFRGDGTRDIGRLADACFHDVGSAGGHRTLARAEFPFSAVPAGEDCAEFVQTRLQRRKLRPAG